VFQNCGQSLFHLSFGNVDISTTLGSNFNMGFSTRLSETFSILRIPSPVSFWSIPASCRLFRVQGVISRPMDPSLIPMTEFLRSGFLGRIQDTVKSFQPEHGIGKFSQASHIYQIISVNSSSEFLEVNPMSRFGMFDLQINWRCQHNPLTSYHKPAQRR